METDEKKMQSHIVSTNHLQKCRKSHSELTTKNFKMFFDIRPEIEEIYKLENGKTHNFWHL